MSKSVAGVMAALLGLCVSISTGHAQVRCRDIVDLSYSNPMTFCMRSDIFVSAIGHVSKDTPIEFLSFLETVVKLGYEPHSVTFHSPGGSLLGGVTLGRVIRKLKLDTHVGKSSKCASACMLAFIGGWSRKVTHDGRIGNHQLSDSATDVASIEGIQDLIGYLVEYHKEMNVSPLAVTAAMTRHADEIYWYDSRERSEWGIVTKR